MSTADACSFCDKNRSEVTHLLAKGDVAICSECVIYAQSTLLADMKRAMVQLKDRVPSAENIENLRGEVRNELLSKVHTALGLNAPESPQLALAVQAEIDVDEKPAFIVGLCSYCGMTPPDHHPNCGSRRQL